MVPYWLAACDAAVRERCRLSDDGVRPPDGRLCPPRGELSPQDDRVNEDGDEPNNDWLIGEIAKEKQGQNTERQK